MVSTITVIAVAQVGSLFSADAWNNVTFTAGEVRNPQRNLPLSLAVGTGAVILIYIAVNFIYLLVLPLWGDPAATACSGVASSMPRRTAWPRPSCSRSWDRAARS